MPRHQKAKNSHKQRSKQNQRFNSGRMDSRGNGWLGLVFVVVVVVAGFLLWQNRVNLQDWYSLRGYTAPAEIKALADETGMSEPTRKLFYLNRPDLGDKTEFSKRCPNGGHEQTIVLGCYHSGQNGIFLIRVQEPLLEGVEQVTAAHEVLHAIYDRLAEDKKAEVNKLLEDFYKNGLTDERVKKTIDSYRESAPNDLVNEMHSIFGTEIVDLPEALEDYYAQHFTSRKSIAQMAQRYQSEFTSRQDQVKSYDSQLETLKPQIEALKAEVSRQGATLNTEKARMDSLRNSDQIAAYNAAVPAYNAMVDEYNGVIAETKALIDRYNNLVAARNAIALEQDHLLEELKGNHAAPAQ